MLPGVRRNVLGILVRIFDLVAVCLVFLFTLAACSGSLSWPGFAEVLVIRIKVANLLLFTGYMTLCSIIFSAVGLYRSHRLSHWHQRRSELLVAVTLITGVLLALSCTISLVFATNKFLLVFWLLSLCTLMLSHEIARRLGHLARLWGRNLRNVIIVGEGPEAAALADHLRQEARLGYHILRTIDAKELRVNERIAGDI